MDTDPFHMGEREAQALAGVQPPGASIRSVMPDQHRVFFAQLPLLFAGVADKAGWPVATALAGPPGFVSSPDPCALHIAAVPGLADPATSGLRTGVPIGLLGIDFGTRRRNRANGTVTALNTDGITVGVLQSFGNCPQYIQTRDAEDAKEPARPVAVECLAGLDQAAREMVAGADTFFVASGSDGRGGRAGGMDVSHRGGRPGFVRVDGDVLTIPDFRGNRYFNTLGNLLLDPRVGLLFMDFATGGLLQLQGCAAIVWGGEEVRSFAGAERLWRVRVTAGWRHRAALPVRWTFRSYASTTERTGTWNTAMEDGGAQLSYSQTGLPVRPASVRCPAAAPTRLAVSRAQSLAFALRSEAGRNAYATPSPVTRQITSPTSSAISKERRSAPSATPTGRP